jgi:hypothetical protein
MEITLSFSSKKNYNKFMRNYANGKGTVISSKNADLISSEVSGNMQGEGFGDFVRGVKNVGKSAVKSDIGKALIKEGIRAGAQGATMAMASRGVPMPIAGIVSNAGAQYANQRVDGLGFLSNLKSAGKSALTSNIGKTIAKEGIKLGTNMARDQLAQRGYDGAITNTLLSAGNQLANQQINSMGQGFGGPGLSESIANINQMKMSRVRAHKRGGSFRLPN